VAVLLNVAMDIERPLVSEDYSILKVILVVTINSFFLICLVLNPYCSSMLGFFMRRSCGKNGATSESSHSLCGILFMMNLQT
jgi:hypothetical protein